MLSRYAARRVGLRPFLRTARWAHTSSTPKLNPVTPDDVAHFASILPASSILSTHPPFNAPPSELAPYNDDWMNKYHGRATTVLRPRTTEEVSAVVRWCNERRIGVVPQGGNTGLVGGGVPTSDELVTFPGAYSASDPGCASSLPIHLSSPFTEYTCTQ